MFGLTVPVGITSAGVERTEALMIGVLLVVWVLAALGVALAFGRCTRFADARSGVARPFTTADLPAEFRPSVSSRR